MPIVNKLVNNLDQSYSLSLHVCLFLIPPYCEEPKGTRKTSRKNCINSMLTRPIKSCNQTPRHSSTKIIYIIDKVL